MPKTSILFTRETWEALQRYLTEKYGERRALSLTVESAVKEWLAKEQRR